MKTKLILIACLAAALPCAARAQTTNDLVRTEVRVQSKADNKDIANSSASTKTQHETLEIQLSGKQKSPESRVVKWFIFGRNLKSNDVTVLASGEEKVSLDAHGQQMVETKTATTTSTPDHSVVSKSKGRGGSSGRVSVKKVEGTGVKYIGYGVQVKDGGTIVGKAFSGQSLEAEVK